MISESEYIEVINSIAFMIHESYYDSTKWDNEEFIRAFKKYTWQNWFIFSKLPSKPITTLLGDVFIYEAGKGSIKRVNDKIVYDASINAYSK